MYTQPDPDAYLASYVENYLRQEVLEEGRTRNLATFSRFLESASFSQAAPLNVAEVARDVGVDRKTAVAYFDLLEDFLIATRVPVFTKRAKRRMTTHPKFFLFDVGVFRAIRPAGPLDNPEQIDGPALETLVYQELRAAIAYRSLKLDLFFWRTASGTEVDFVAYGGDGLFAIEVKRTRTIRRADLHGLKQFRTDYPMARCVLLFGGDRREHRDAIELLPLAEALADPTLLAEDRLVQIDRATAGCSSQVADRDRACAGSVSGREDSVRGSVGQIRNWCGIFGMDLGRAIPEGDSGLPVRRPPEWSQAASSSSSRSRSAPAGRLMICPLPLRAMPAGGVGRSARRAAGRALRWVKTYSTNPGSANGGEALERRSAALAERRHAPRRFITPPELRK